MKNTKQIFLFLATMLLSEVMFGQYRVKGTVFDKRDKFPLEGVSILEKGTRNGLFTKEDGTFELELQDSTATLVFSSIGYIPQEISVNSEEDIQVRMKGDCMVCWFDHQRISFYAQTGLLNNPIGGKFDLSLPVFYRQLTIKGEFAYQTNVKNNRYLNGTISLLHLFNSCYFSSDLRLHTHSIKFENEFDNSVNSGEIDLNFNRLFRNRMYLKVILGYSEMRLREDNIQNSRTSGPLVGLGTYLGRRLNIMFIGKASFYPGKIEYQGQIDRDFKRIKTFVNFYKLNSYQEISLGIGYRFTYWLRPSEKVKL